MSELGLILLGVIPVGVVFLSWCLMRTLTLPRLGCWLFYLASLVALFLVLVGGLLLIAAAAIVQHILKDVPPKDIQTYVASATAVVLMFLGKWFLKARNLKPFSWLMQWFLKHSFTPRVGAIKPSFPASDPRQLAYRAVFDDQYGGDLRYGTVMGWGVRACCTRLLQIKNNH